MNFGEKTIPINKYYTLGVFVDLKKKMSDISKPKVPLKDRQGTKTTNAANATSDAPSFPESPEQNLPAQGAQSSSSDTGVVGTTPEGNASTFADMAGIISQVVVLNLDLRGHFTPFNIPVLEKIIHSVQALFKFDEGFRIQQLRGGAGIGIYRILLPKPVEDVINKYVTFKTTDGEIKVPLALPQYHNQHTGGQGREEGLLVTFLNADAGTATLIPAKTFDEAMLPYGNIIKCTQQQRYRGTSCLNTNMYCVIANEGKDKVLGTISILNPRTNQMENFQIRYRGQS